MPPSQIQVELPFSQVNDFQEFVFYHQKIKAFRKTNNNFSINLKKQNREEYLAFLKGIKDTFQIKEVKENCQAKCRDGTDCLNKAHYTGYCWKHKRITDFVKIKKRLAK